MDRNKIYCGKSERLLRELDPGSIDLTVTSPPYDNLRGYNGFSLYFTLIARGLWRATKPGGVVVWVVSDETKDGSESLTSFKQALYFNELGFNLHDTMIYQTDKPPLNGNRYQSSFEYMFIFSKGAPKTFNPILEGIAETTKGRRRYKMKSQFHRNIDGSWNEPEARSNTSVERVKDNIWYYFAGYSANDRISSKHPAVFPEALARDHIISWSNPGDLILDPFCGSGTTLKMAKETGRDWIGFDISSEYCKISQKRVDSANVPLPGLL